VVTELRLGRWQDVLADVGEVDAVITDPPFSERTAKGFKSNPHGRTPLDDQAPISYGFITRDDAFDLAEAWASRTRRWVVVFGDHVSARWHEEAWSAAGWYTFPPVPWIKPAAPPRFLGDGPSSQAEWITVARPRTNIYRERLGSRPGYYIAKRGIRGTCGDGIVTGTKDPLAMRALIRDYTEPGDCIVDPFAGGATTLLAAAMEGRRAIGAEQDPDTFAKAQRRLACGYTPDLFGAVS